MTSQSAAIENPQRQSFLRDLSLLLLIPAVSTFYNQLNHAGRGAHSLMTDLDRAIPVIEAFVLPYLAWYGFILIAFVYLCRKDRTSYYQTLVSTIIGLLVSYTIYFFYQTTVPRPVLTGHDVFTVLLQYVYSTDQPYNCFPSIHVLTSYLILRGFKGRRQLPRFVRGAVWLMSVMIIVSTLFVKQHVLMDVLGAIVLSELIRSVVKIFIPDVTKEADPTWQPKPYSWSTTRRKL
ncbi:phosphatase PAP2 family protein [Paenibacillus sp. GD4]|uniref:phosphatase PAP2 family protein n=1 Tax=Paenibacillus sp. GD4 TaxID=3068890 RepID=UPI0027964322|nr:phosphatase PAP2 family protein [Paenibacillus sp. GD4]MDQ1912173.1 phosphatase PAP2 family protein [Paenibacillus sp. GD4]